MSIIHRLRTDLRPVWRAVFRQKTAMENTLPRMAHNIDQIMGAARALEAALVHLRRTSIGDDQYQSLVHLTMFAENLPLLFQRDPGLWGYALALVEPDIFGEGAEAVELEQLLLLQERLRVIIAEKS